MTYQWIQLLRKTDLSAIKNNIQVKKKSPEKSQGPNPAEK